MKTSESEIDWLKITNRIINKLKKQFTFIPVDEIEASAFVGVAIANSVFDSSKNNDIESWLYFTGCKRTIDDLRHRKLIDRANAVKTGKEISESDISGDTDWSIFDLDRHSTDAICDFERKDFWKEVIKSLSKIEKKSIILHYKENKQIKQIAVLLELTEGRISQIIKEALLKIKKRFEEREFNWNEFFS